MYTNLPRSRLQWGIVHELPGLQFVYYHELPLCFIWSVIFGTRVLYKQNCHTTISFILKYHTRPPSFDLASSQVTPQARPWNLLLHTSRAPTPEKTATSSRLPHDFSSGQSYHGIRRQVIKPVLRNLPCYLHRMYQVLCFNNYTPSKSSLYFIHKLEGLRCVKYRGTYT